MGFDAARYYSSKKKSFNWKPFRRRQEFLELLLHVLITHSSTFVYFVIPNNLWTQKESLRQLPASVTPVNELFIQLQAL